MQKAEGSLSQLKSVRSTQPWQVVISDLKGLAFRVQGLLRD